MVILLNGAFGIGKTTVARAVQQALPRAIVFDPERVGYVLQRTPRWLSLQGSGTDDFQDMPAWRSLSVQGIRLARWIRPVVIVPMAFSNVDYLNEVRTGVSAFESDIRHLCLIAPLEVVQGRLRERGSNDAWSHRKAAACCEVHGRPEFGEHIPTAGRAVTEVVRDVLDRAQR